MLKKSSIKNQVGLVKENRMRSININWTTFALYQKSVKCVWEKAASNYGGRNLNKLKNHQASDAI